MIFAEIYHEPLRFVLWKGSQLRLSGKKALPDAMIVPDGVLNAIP
jgi:hypothetical protein